MWKAGLEYSVHALIKRFCLSFIKPAGSVGDSTAEDSNLPVDHLTARAANSLPPLDTGLEIEHSAHVLVKFLMQAPQVL